MPKFIWPLTLLAFFLAQCTDGMQSEPKVIGGEIVEERVPYMASLVDKNHKFVFCGGSLIAPNVVLTAAHCVEGGSPFYVALGLKTVKESEVQQDLREVNAMVIHPRWGQEIGNDLALVFLKKSGVPASQAEEISPIPINEQDSIPLIGSNVQVMGFGNTTSSGVVEDPFLREVELKVIAESTCREQPGYEDLSEGELCAGDLFKGGSDSCQGDSGGPLVTVGANPTLVGIVSWGVGCAQKQKPGVYTRVSHYSEWIKSSIAAYQNIPDVSDGSQAAKILEGYCQPQIASQIFAEDGSYLSLSSRSTIQGELTPLEADFDLDQTLAQRDLTLASRCLFKDENGQAFQRVFARPTQASPQDRQQSSFVAAGTQWYEAKAASKLESIGLQCRSGTQFSLLSHSIASGSYNYFTADKLYRGTRVEPIEVEGAELISCRVGDYETRLFSVHEHLYLSYSRDPQAQALWLRLDEVSDEVVQEEPLVQLRVTPVSASKGVLEVFNSGSEDIFTWQLSCPFAFYLKEGNQAAIESQKVGNNFLITLQHPQVISGSILQGSSRVFGFGPSDASLPLLEAVEQSCVVNGSRIAFEIITPFKALR